MIVQIKILVSSITNITKKKTAIIIPNAVGIVTKDHKVCGSFINRAFASHNIWILLSLVNASFAS